MQYNDSNCGYYDPESRKMSTEDRKASFKNDYKWSASAWFQKLQQCINIDTMNSTLSQ